MKVNRRLASIALILALVAVILMFSLLSISERTHDCCDVYCDTCSDIRLVERASAQVMALILVSVFLTFVFSSIYAFVKRTDEVCRFDLTPVGQKVELLD